MLHAKNLFVILLMLAGGLAQGQQVNLLFRQPVNLLQLSSLWDDHPSKSVHVNLAAEYIPRNSAWAYMLNLGYAYKTAHYNNPSNPAPREPFFRETYMVGAVGRRYWGKDMGSTRFFAEAGVQTHFIQRHESIAIWTPYAGMYREYATHTETMWSGSLGLGLSMELFWKIRFEPNIQFVFSSRSQKRLRKEVPLLLPSGTRRLWEDPVLLEIDENYQLLPFHQFLFVSLSVKVPLFSPSE